MGRKEGLLRAISGFCLSGGVGMLVFGFFAGSAVCWLSGSLALWPFLELLVVYWRCPCAGRHLLFFACRKEK
jgi:fructose-specific phosphotransferase system IIC component